MKTVGVISVYSFRPHQEHLRRLVAAFDSSEAWQLKLAICGGFRNCYKQTVRPAWPRLMVCTACRVTSGLMTHAHDNLVPAKNIMLEPRHYDWISSSLCTKYRYEDPERLDRILEHPEAETLAEGAAGMYQAARNWMQSSGLDLVVCFNGRMDLSRAVLEAARDLDIPIVSLDRAWFGEGVHLTPDDTPLGQKQLRSLISRFMDKPLTREQAEKIHDLLAARLRGNLPGEFRQYDIGHESDTWTQTPGKRRILFVPSSINEFVGHPDRAVHWRHPVDAIDCLLENNWLTADELLVRFHPGWAQKLSFTTGQDSTDFYRQWCESRGIRYIEPDASVRTSSLIAQCDLLLFNGSSAFFEAGMHGKRILALVPTPYAPSGIIDEFCAPDQFDNLSRPALPVDEYLTRFLRFSYAFHYRAMQYTDVLHSGANMPQSDVKRLDFFEHAMNQREFLAYDTTYATGDDDEQALIAERFSALLQPTNREPGQDSPDTP